MPTEPAGDHVRIVSDGTRQGTNVFANGERIRGVQRVEFILDVKNGGVAAAWIQVVKPELEVDVPAELADVHPVDPRTTVSAARVELEAPMVAIARILLLAGPLTAVEISGQLLREGYGPPHEPPTYGWVYAQLAAAHERGEVLRIGETPTRWQMPRSVS